MKIKEIISDLKKLLIVKHTVTIIVQEITVFMTVEITRINITLFYAI